MIKPVRRAPELLAPGGTLRKVETALRYGADAVYVGGRDLNLRAGAAGLSQEELARAVGLAAQSNASIYYCLNILAGQDHLAGVERRLHELAQSGIHGVIIADPGVLRLARRILPNTPIHLSTQANTSNGQSVAFWKEAGVARVNLARELGLRQVQALMHADLGVEVELFVHGAMCMALSGRCLMSSYLNERSANLGACTHPCRYEYRVASLGLEERTREGEVLWDVGEAGPYAALLAAEDLCLIPYLPWLTRQGIDAVKIEGRMKSESYLALVTDVFRTGLDDLVQGRFRLRSYLRELALSATRPHATGFFLSGRRRKVLEPIPQNDRSAILGKVEDHVGPHGWRVAVLHRWLQGEKVRVLSPGLRRPSIGAYGLESLEGAKIDGAHPGTSVVLRCESSEPEPGLFLMTT